MSLWFLFLVALLYFICLFTIALYGDSNTGKHTFAPLKPYIYALSIAVYCSSWTFYGAVGTATQQGWDFLPIYLGPFLVFVFGHSVIRKIIRIGKRQNTTSIADFLASRYGKKRGIGFLTTMICTVACIPYIALQLKAVSNSVTLLTDETSQSAAAIDVGFVVALSMIGFAILFGTRQVDAARHHHGMMLTIAFESLVKLAALVALAMFVIFVFLDGPAEFIETLASSDMFIWQSPSLNFLTQLILAAGAILVLPREFHVMVVENTNHDHLNTARWVFPLYLFLVSVVVLPIAIAGQQYFTGTSINADSFVLMLPQVSDQTWLTILVFIGGFSASMAMVVITTLTLSTMLSNDVILPYVMRRNLLPNSMNLGVSLILTRRLTIAAVILIAWSYNIGFGHSEALSSIGLLAFTLVVQLIPPLLGGLYWKKGHAQGAYAGMIVGSLIWAWTLLVPMLHHAGYLSDTLMNQGPLGISWLRPEFLFGFEFSDGLSHGVFFSLLGNSLFYVAFSRRANSSITDRLQASAYVSYGEHLHRPGTKKSQVKSGELVAMLERFAGTLQTQTWVGDFERVNHTRMDPNDRPTAEFVRYIERTLSGVIGASSARAMMHSALAGRELQLEDVVTFFDETTQAIQFNQKVLSSTLENLDHGVSVIDRDLRLVAWNRKYLAMYDYPKDLIRVGTPIEELVRFNASRGECGPGDIEELIQKRLNHLHAGTAHRFIRMRNNGSVTEIRGNPLPGGGFVTTFNDITEFVKAQDALQEAKNTLELRVEERTEEVREINAELRAEIVEREKAEAMLMEAKTEAEYANESKTRFLALASHDILQPLNAARLYNSALIDRWPGDPTVLKLESALHTSEELISTLLEIAKLDGNPKTPEFESVSLDLLFESIDHEFSAMADEKGLSLNVRYSGLFVTSESRPLRRIIQNLISNAIKYTRDGGVLLAARKRAGGVSIEVWDTGLGINQRDQKRIFLDFSRLEIHRQEAQGVGLGLSVVSRISDHLGHAISVFSRPGKGSCFKIQVALTQPSASRDSAPKPPTTDQPADFASRTLIIDNDLPNTDALSTLLAGWGCKVRSASSSQEALKEEIPPDFLIVDYDLGNGLTGVQLKNELIRQWQTEVPAILVTAHDDSSIKKLAQSESMLFLSKPVKPAALRSLIKTLQRQRSPS